MKKSDMPLCLAELARLYPDAAAQLSFRSPYELLVAVMLSAQSTDVQVNKVTPAVFRDFPTVQAMAETTPETLLPYVKSCGFKSKATNIVMAARKIVSDFGGSVPAGFEQLTSLPGVGRKTANVVLSNAFHIPAIAVDTHVFRVTNRLGLAKAPTPEKTEEQLKRHIPKENWSDAHHWLIYHGRQVCKAQRPLCGACTLKPYCDHFKKTHDKD